MEPLNDYAGDNTNRANKRKRRRSAFLEMTNENVEPVPVNVQNTIPSVPVNEKAKKLEADWAEYKIKKEETKQKNTDRVVLVLICVAGLILAYIFGGDQIQASMGNIMSWGFILLIVAGLLHVIFVDIPEKLNETKNKVKKYKKSLDNTIEAEQKIDEIAHMMALEEVAERKLDPYCMAQAIKGAYGDDKMAVSIYMKIRVKDLKEKIRNSN
ncbi:hypothetical protein Tola_2672 [Tolumonas auensis DSM 9187]|uniref:Uncharacterized protein n=1 Tax=Tolumonas auensis (strain DSM 9187 / NBRC 110442 / TA 4) TaxID=595494 RepID=C4LB63_TOLAT|nr:hypothetical protein [Tolumonas auensis]ACQ94266.1 hypothetical protein Tola_2672 [Tolumonas auensis DSM 9187]